MSGRLRYFSIARYRSMRLPISIQGAEPNASLFPPSTPRADPRRPGEGLARLLDRGALLAVGLVLAGPCPTIAVDDGRRGSDQPRRLLAARAHPYASVRATLPPAGGPTASCDPGGSRR